MFFYSRESAPRTAPDIQKSGPAKLPDRKKLWIIPR